MFILQSHLLVFTEAAEKKEMLPTNRWTYHSDFTNHHHCFVNQKLNINPQVSHLSPQ